MTEESDVDDDQEPEPERFSHPPADSRPAVRLRDHLHDVADRVTHVVPADTTVPAGDRLRDVVRAVALVHDMGKASTWFQQHIGMVDGEPPDTVHTHHSLFGAFLAAYVLDQRGYGDETMLAGTHAVLRHHGTLGDCAETLFSRALPTDSRRTHQRQAVIDQVEEIDRSVPSLATSIVSAATDSDGSWSEYVREIESGAAFERVSDSLSHPGFVRTLTRDLVSETFYETTLSIWSALVLCDKTSAAGAPPDSSVYEPTPVTFETLDDHISKLQESAPAAGKSGELNEQRQRAREQVLETVRSESPTVSHLTLPTGLGKTFTGLSAALELRDSADRSRIIYALPFTSIIDQVGDELTEVFDSDGHDGRVLLHHHLSDATITLEDEDGDEDTDARAAIEGMLGGSWRASVVLTTFVQLFESLAGPHNTQSMKLPALTNSIVILDEPQSLPHTWWPLVRRLTDILTERYNASIIAMTATQPRLYERDTTELIKTPDAFYRDLDRVTFELDESLIEFPDSEAAVRFDVASDRLHHHSDESVLCVCNTIASAKSLYETVVEGDNMLSVGDVLSDQLGRSDGDLMPSDLADTIETREGRPTEVHHGGRPVMFLSTRVRPRDRLFCIKTAKELTDRGVPLLCISTQLIESGVDISFERVYRDFAPMDSIVQAAGRCNRSYEGNTGETGSVTVWWLRGESDSSITPGEAVYNRWSKSSLLSITAGTLQSVAGDKQTVTEPTLTWQAVREYYDRLAEVNPGNREFVEYVNGARADKLSQLSLIEERNAVELVVTRTQADRNAIEAARESFEAFDFSSFREQLESLRDRQVSVPVYPHDSSTAVFGELPRLVTTEEQNTTDLRVLDTDRFSEFFDPALGVITLNRQSIPGSCDDDRSRRPPAGNRTRRPRRGTVPRHRCDDAVLPCLQARTLV